MTDRITFKFTGTEELSAKFKSLSENFRRQVALPAAKDAMEIVLSDSRDYAARIDDLQTPNDISLNIDMIERKKLGEEIGAVVMSVGVRKRKRGVKGGNTYYWWWVELGTQKTMSRPFLRAPLHNNRDRLFREFISSARYQLVKLGKH